MPIQEQAASRVLETIDDLEETRLEAVGFIFHGVPRPATVPAALDGKANGNGRAPAPAKLAPVKAGQNILHLARCTKIDRAATGEAKIWFRSVRVAKAELDVLVGAGRWKWCKLCEREITQRILNEH